MKVTAKIQDHPSDTRVRDTTTNAKSNASSGDRSDDFGGVLSDVTSDSKSASSDAADKADKTSKAGPSIFVAPVAVAPTAVTPIAMAEDVGSMSALFDLIGKGAPIAPMTKDDAKTKPSSDGEKDPVDSFLEKIAKDAEAPATPAAPSPPPTPAPASDLASLLMLGAAPVQAAAPATPATAAATSKTGADTVVPGSHDMPLDGTEKAKSGEVLVSNVTVETHLAPAAPNNAADLSDSHRKPATEGTATLQLDDAKPSAEPAAAVDASSQISNVLSTPVRAIASAVVDLASRSDTVSASAQPTTVDASKPVLGVARTMTLQMNPADLGTVDIRLHMTGQTLDVQLTVSDPRTLGMVSRERDGLANALSDQSYALNSLVIQDGGAIASSGGNNAASQGDTSGSNTRSDRQSGGFGSDGQGNGRPAGQGADREPPRDRSPAPDSLAHSGASQRNGSLFV